MPLDRRVLLRAAAVAPLAGLAACGAGDDGSPSSGSSRSTSPSASPSTQSPSRSASPSQTASASESPSASPTDQGPPRPAIARTLAQDLAVPWGIAFLPDGSALVSCRDSFEIVRIGGRRTSVVGTVPGVVTTVDSGGEGGLLGLALHPDYPRKPWLYAYHTTDEDNRVVRMRLMLRGSGGRLGDPEPILTGINTSLHHNGGGLRFATDGHLFVSTGDAENSDDAQDKGSLNGKILRITDTGGVPPDNPFGNEVWTYGHRNVEGLALDAGGQLWASEFGDKAYDELNRIVKGDNYGWPYVEGAGGGYHDPLAQWPTSECSPSGIAITRGRAWLGALQGECVWSVDLDSGKTQRYLDGHGRLRLVAAAPDGSLWVGTSHRDGRDSPGPGDDRIYRVTL
ncbi:PQQ-dependent sugar dehydrogenase [Nocardioides cheoyonin]|uniref:PQQ-dependent sugar dehydrogenase n=1 Tax=Nocardioides cheoyonin TaxID=3156615 RepID=UPI0032B32DAF